MYLYPSKNRLAMENGLLHLHNLMRWVVIILAVLTVLKALRGMGGNKSFTAGDRKTAMFYMISFDIQLLIGLAVYFLSSKGWFRMLTAGGVMKNEYQRFFAVEHAIGMLIALILVHRGYSAVKKNIPDATKFKRLFWYSLLSLIITLAMIPWPFRELVGRPWFPGM